MGRLYVRPIEEVATDLGILPNYLVAYGRWKVKVSLAAFQDLQRPPGKVIMVTAMTPTAHGEGETVTSIRVGYTYHDSSRGRLVTTRTLTAACHGEQTRELATGTITISGPLLDF